MTFVTAGLAIAGLAAIAIPILIHLLWRQRRKPIQWAAMRFLLEAYRKHRRRLQVEQLLLLAVRCLILALLGAALARPLLEGTDLLDRGGSRLVYFIIDNGIASSVTVAPGETALDQSAEHAANILSTLAMGDRVGVITAARPSVDVLTPPSSDHIAVGALINAMESSAAPTDIAGALERLRSALEVVAEDQDRVFVYLLSDFRTGSAPLDESLPSLLGDLSERVTLLAATPAVESIANVQVARIEPVRSIVLPGAADASGQVTVRLERHGGDLGPAVTRVEMLGSDLARLEPRTVTWQRGETETSADFMLEFPARREREAGISVRIDSDALTLDNQRFAALSLRDRIRAVMIDRRSFGFEPTLDRLTAGQWMRRALEPIEASPIEIIEVEPAALDVADLRTADVAILPRPDLLTEGGWTKLREFVDHGGLLIVTPPAEANIHEWVDHLRDDLELEWSVEREVTEFAGGAVLAEDQPPSALLRMISSDLGALLRPVIVHRALRLQSQSADETRAEAALVLADGSPLIAVSSPQPPDSGSEDATSVDTARGLVVYLAAAPQLDWTNLPSKPLMVPLFQELVRQGLSITRTDRAVNVADRAPLPVSPVAHALLAPDGAGGGGARIALDQQRRPERPLAQPGQYTVIDLGGQPVGLIPVNIDTQAARTDPQSPDAVKAWLAGSGGWTFFDDANRTAALADSSTGSPLAGILLLLVLLLIIIETVLARWFSHARAARGGIFGASGAERGTGELRPTMQEKKSGAGEQTERDRVNAKPSSRQPQPQTLGGAA